MQVLTSFHCKFFCRRLLIAIVGAMSLSACSVLTFWQDRDALVTSFPWFAAAKYLPEGTWQQQFVFNRDGNSQTFQAVTNIENGHAQMVVMSELGNRITTVSFDGEEFTLHPKRNIFLNLPYQSVLAGWMLGLVINEMDADKIDVVGLDSEWRFSDSATTKQIFHGDEMIAMVDYVAANQDNSDTSVDNQLATPIRFHHHRLGFDLRIQSILL